MPGISRRDFLKMVPIAPLFALVRPLGGALRLSGRPVSPNIIILVFDAWSADHLSLHGYARNTMPNLEGFADRAVVYHRHYSAGTFTVPGTASLLTGLHPWSHRAFALGGEIIASHLDHQLFHLLTPSHHTVGFSQNEYADLLLAQTGGDLDRRLPVGSFSLHPVLAYSAGILQHDPQVAHASLENGIFQRESGADGSLYFGPLRRLMQWRATKSLDAEYAATYPRGLPASPDLFRMQDVVNGTIDILGSLPQPCLAYLHLYPPHGEYRPKGKFNRSFEDGWHPPQKPAHPLIQNPKEIENQENQRWKYDQYTASWDAELARLFDFLKISGLLDTSYVIITSDHGEMFERGVIGHYTPLIYDALVHVPLIISRPDQTSRIDVRTPTSGVDLLPTVASLAGLAAPTWAEGRLLPAFGGTPDQDRSIYVVDAKTNSAFAKLTRFSMSLTKDEHRLTYYQYPDSDYARFELYHLLDDPHELRDLYSEGSALAMHLRDELLQKLVEANRPFAGE